MARLISAATKPFSQSPALPSAKMLVELVVTWRQRLQTRQVLARMEAHELHDIGLCRMRAEAECAKPFWRA